MRSTFWSKIVIEPGPFNTEPTKVQEIVAFFIDCTHGQPFSFEFCMDYGGLENRLHLVFADLCAYSEQWEEASIGLLSPELKYFCAIQGRLPLLRKLEIFVSCLADSTTSIPSMVTNVFEDAPLLTHVGLWDINTWQFNFNWSSLTIIKILYLQKWEGFLAILRETNLVELMVVGSRGKDLRMEGGELIHLPCLERLSVDWTPLLTVLETPSLQQLKISLNPYDNLNDARTTLGFLRRLGIKLNYFLIWSDSEVRAADVKEILRGMPEVDRLTLMGVLDTVFKWLAETRTQELRCSNLIVFWYHTTLKETGMLEALNDMIARRNLPGDVRNPSPKEVIVGTPWGWDQALTANLKSLCRDRGIRFGFIHEMSTLPWGLYE